MGAKLSQTVFDPTSENHPRDRICAEAARIGFLLILMLATISSLACRNPNDDALLGSASEASAKSSENESFDWPEDPNHPVIRIDIDGAAGQGAIEIELMPELAPETVRQLLEWVDSGYYDGTTFHRVIKGFMIQGGDPNTRDRDPTNDGQGGPGFRLKDEISAAPFVRGVVGMGNTGRPDSAGSQFFIMQADRRELDGGYTVIGRVRSGIDRVDAIVDVDTDRFGRWGPKNRPIENVVLTRVRGIGSTSKADKKASASDASRLPDSKARRPAL